MLNIGQWSLRAKIVILGVGLPILLAGLLLHLYVKESRAKAQTALIDKARAICLTAESTREEMEQKWRLGLFSAAQLQSYAAKGQLEELLAAVPVVTAWRSAMRLAEAGQYTFKVPKEKPRNPGNQPDDLERRALSVLKERNLDEYVEVDLALNAIRFFRPVRLSESCLLCHGDPATSQALWGNDRGQDPTGGPMENWRASEIHGAFEVIQSLAPAQATLTASLNKAYQIVGAGLLVMAFLFASLAVRMVSRSVVRPIRDISQMVSTGASQLLETARQVDTSSHHLADGSVNQAASLEQSSAALEEVTAMTQSNADNVRETSHVARDLRVSAETAHVSMSKMTSAIGAIKQSSDETARIIKTIDEIAFQTNLLSLNAAVEAARAGEAGAGFAVVAEEVRNLALRSADAARETTRLLETAKGNSDEGVTAAQEVTGILNTIIDGVKKVSELAAQISRASDEQAEGVQQVNIGVAEIDKVTQDNAAISQEVASASQALSHQAQELNGLVAELTRVVGGGKDRRLANRHRLSRIGHPRSPLPPALPEP